jgi:hypothetical protein
MTNTPPPADPLGLDLHAARAAEEAIIEALARLLLAPTVGKKVVPNLAQPIPGAGKGPDAVGKAATAEGGAP